VDRTSDLLGAYGARPKRATSAGTSTPFGSRAIGNVTNDGCRNRFPNYRVLRVDEETAASYAALRSELKAGTPIPSNDIGIAPGRLGIWQRISNASVKLATLRL
jgi:hypothetical protein